MRDLIRDDQFFDPRFDFIGQLEAVVREKFDAVVLIRIMRGGNHHAGIGPQAPRQEGDRRRRHRTDEQYVDAHGADARHQGRLQHIAGDPRILPDDDLMTPGPAHENMRGGASQLHRGFAGHRLEIRRAPNAVGTEELTHVVLALQRIFAARSRRRPWRRLSSARHRAHEECSRPARPPGRPTPAVPHPRSSTD